MPNNSGVFSLSTYYNKDLSGDIPNRNRESYREYGYFHSGGIDGFPYYTKIERIDYSNDTVTASFRSSYSVALGYPGVVGNISKSYTMGGRSASAPTLDSSYVLRFDYSNETITRVADLVLKSNYSVSTGNNFFGYTNPTYDAAFVGRSFICRLDYSNDLATASIRGPLSLARTNFAAISNSNFGYFGGGTVSTVDRINYSNDSFTASVRSPLSVARSFISATGNSNFGYFGGGNLSTIDRINYANDLATASVRGPLSASRRRLSATGNSNFGYFCGGDTSPALSSVFSLIDRIDYSNDTITASVRGSLNIPTNGGSATSSSSFGGSPISQYGVFAKPFGYFGGGGAPAAVSTVDRIDYSNDTNTAAVRGSLTANKIELSSSGNSNFGYFFGGNTGSPAVPFSTIDRLDYSNDNQSIIARNFLLLSKRNTAAISNINFGYLGGGIADPTQVSTVERINYSSDNLTLSIRGSLSLARYDLSATGNSNFGYFAGGGFPTTYSTIDRIDYSNDTATASTRNILNYTTRNQGSTGNNNFGYFAGGGGPISSVDRLDYSNDTTAVSVRGALSSRKSDLSATGNSNFGYFSGGSGPISTVDRIDYANDTTTATIRSRLSTARTQLSATSPTAFGGATDFQATSTFFDIQSMRKIEDTTNYSVKKRVLGSYGYFGGGVTPAEFGGVSAVDRIDYSNDTQTATYRTNITIGRRTLSSTSNSNFGYFYGGENPAVQTLIDRIDYSNDSSTAVFRSYITSRPGGRLAAGGNNNFAYNGSGFVSFIDRTDYSNDLTNASRRGNLISTKNASSFVGNNNFGYIVSGELVGNGSTLLSRVDRIDYSNDNSNASVRGPLTLARWFFSGTGNSNFGYVGGGGTLGVVSSVERINYSTDTSTALVRGPLSSSRYALAATGNSNYGWFGGGGTPAVISTIDRIDFSNDTPTASVRGPLSIQRSTNTATTNARSS
jgi:hypothetical protein